ncbi:tetratricopeptide repeat protein [Terriglobus sp. ADX1]|uniref:tetratricopeptide repeat protein n=1 Tax=Terriglobus sp. ADX1 TaxID=2794063 RepID=UPI002FE5F46F
MRILAAVLLFSLPAAAQMEMPPGTTSAVPQEQAKPPASQATLAKAEDAIANGKYADAVTLLTPLATEAQSNARVFYDLGFAQDTLNHDIEAAAAYAKSISLKSDDAGARISLGLLYARMGETPKAEEQLRAATKIEGAEKDLLARTWRALAEIDLKSNPEMARNDLLSALKYAPETPDDAATAAEIAEAMGDDAAAEQAYAHAFSLSPASVDVALGYARMLTRSKKFSQADQVLTSALAQHPGNHALMAERASEQLLQGKTEAAVPVLESLHADEPGNAAVTMLLARAYSAAGSPEKAEPIYTALLKASPNDVTLMTEAADTLIRLRRSPEAEPLLQKAVSQPDKFPSKAALAQAAGELAFAASSNKDAVTVLKALAIREPLAPSSAPFTFLAASAHDTLHHTKQAAEAYRQFLSQSGGKYPDQEWQAQQRLQVLSRTK